MVSVFSKVPKYTLANPPSFYANRAIEEYARKASRQVTLKQLVVFGRSVNEDKLLKSANYVRNELPIRLSRRIRDIQNLPFIVGSNPHIEFIYHLYYNAFEKFRRIPPISNLEDNHEFYLLLREMLLAHNQVVSELALGIRETAHHMNPHQADKFLSDMIKSRIGRRVIAQQHMAYSEEWYGDREKVDGIIGLVHTDMSAYRTVQKVCNLVGKLFREQYHISPPKVIIDGHKDASLTYIPRHLEFILFETLKNAMQHTVYSHTDAKLLWDQDSGSPQRPPKMAEETLETAFEATSSPCDSNNVTEFSDLPPIRVTIGDCSTDVMFRVSDQGGGIAKDIIDRVWSFFYLTERNMMQSEQRRLNRTRMGLGMGLAMSRAYADYWGGSLTLASMHGYGTDAYIKISKENLKEQIPI
ncbi:MAG: hypothetical protein SGCHY_003910 [Lobulomycetales sp.]